MSKDGIPADEWFAELQRLSSKDDDGRTVDEWAEAMGCSTATARTRLKKALHMGWLKRGAARREGLSGIMRPVSVYTVVKPQGGKR